jgi:hypothetical protein
VFDRGNSHCLPIPPPKGIDWRSHHVSELNIQDETSSHIGLTFPHIDGALPFICLPCKIALDIIGRCPLKTKYKYWQNKLFIDTLFCIKYTIHWYDMVSFCVHKNLLFHYRLLIQCIVMCKIYLVSSIAILLVVIVSNISNE